jgi:Rps23 Pro-64 3,4-dihydroxylase Tpa1-like proline 4-hydroxylase
MIEAPPLLQIDDFLDRAEYDRLLAHVVSRLDDMRPSQVTHPDHEDGDHDEAFRRSRVATDLDDIWPLFEARLLALLPHVRKELGIPRFEVGRIERQLTVHGDGDFFSRHVDENHPGTNDSRVITFVYYCNVEPRAFTGGTLCVHGRPDEAAGVVDSYVEIEPRANSIVFFPATTSHDVLPVSSDDPGAAGLRWTVNGWFRVGHTGVEALPTVTPETMTMLQERLLPRLGLPEFAVRPTPGAVDDLLAGIWDLRSRDVRPEQSDPTYLPNGDPDFLDLGTIGDEVLEHLRPAHEDWAGQPLVPTAAYGLRAYRRAQRLARHVDRCESHVVTSVVSVHQDVTRPWPLQLEFGGRVHDVHLGSGQLVTFESAAIPHGRYAPLDGDAYVILQLHYRPADWAVSTATLVRAGIDEQLIDRAGRPRVAVPGSR